MKPSPAKTSISDQGIRPSAVKVETSTKATPARSGASYPAVKTSQLDVDAKPVYEPNGKPITEIDMDAGRVALIQ